jgi:hypothetical protein
VAYALEGREITEITIYPDLAEGLAAAGLAPAP